MPPTAAPPAPNDNERLQIAVDGACKGNPGPGGWGWARDDGWWAGGSAIDTTNNAMELQAVIGALEAHPTGPLELLCDSAYVINCLTRWAHGWAKRDWTTKDNKPVANRDMIESAMRLLRGRDVTFTKVKGHSGHPLNDDADDIASQHAEIARDHGHVFTSPPQRA